MSVAEDDENVAVRIRNYGIGIPPDLLEKIRGGTASERADVPDQRQKRTGLGVGLSIVLDVLKDYDGWLEIDSEPADQSRRAPGEEYHRYVTAVDVYVPVAR